MEPIVAGMEQRSGSAVALRALVISFVATVTADVEVGVSDFITNPTFQGSL